MRSQPIFNKFKREEKKVLQLLGFNLSIPRVNDGVGGFKNPEKNSLDHRPCAPAIFSHTNP